jgi:intergrase/recombinase
MLEFWNPAEKVKHPTGWYESRLYCAETFCRYFLGRKEGTKRVDYVYFPMPASDTIKVPKVGYSQLKDLLSKQLKVKSSLFSKFTNQRLEALAHGHNIRLDAVNLIMSRELSVTGVHYLNTRDWADKLFNIYVEWLKEQDLI